MDMPAKRPASSPTVAGYLADLASPNPTPGGGSAVATAGALAAALAEMVAGITLTGKQPPPNSDDLERARADAAGGRAALLALAADDEDAYAAYRAASALPRTTGAEKATRRAAMQSALLRSADVPLAIARACVALLDTLRVTAAHGSKHALSDVSAAVLLAEAAARGALVTARVNADLMTEPATAGTYHRQITELDARVSSSAAGVLDLVRNRTAAP